MNVLVRTAVILFLGILALFRPPTRPELPTAMDQTNLIQRELHAQDAEEIIPPLDEFLDSFVHGGGNGIVGVYVPDLLAMHVVQQPEGMPQFVSQRANVVTQFELASQYGTTGLLAHSHLAGAKFHLLNIGQLVYLITDDGGVKKYVVTEILHYQALSPKSFSSDFRSLDYPSGRLSADDLFFHIYSKRQGVIFQTCFSVNGVLNWGRMFIIALPIDAWWLEMLGWGN